MVYADKNMVDTVVRNLMGNSIKFSNSGSIEIKLAKIGKYCEVSISDNGIGLEEDDISKLFRIEIDPSTVGDSKEKGSGLGLILCKDFVKLNRGEIWVESEFGKGTVFTFSLPVSI